MPVQLEREVKDAAATARKMLLTHGTTSAEAAVAVQVHLPLTVPGGHLALPQQQSHACSPVTVAWRWWREQPESAPEPPWPQLYCVCMQALADAVAAAAEAAGGVLPKYVQSAIQMAVAGYEEGSDVAERGAKQVGGGPPARACWVVHGWKARPRHSKESSCSRGMCACGLACSYLYCSACVLCCNRSCVPHFFFAAGGACA